MVAVLVTNGTMNLSAVNGFYRAESYNLGCISGTILSLITTRYITVTFAHAGNCQGLILILEAVAAGITRSVKVSLQELVGGTTWTTRASKTLTASDICGSAATGTYANSRTEFITPFNFDAPYAVSASAGIWRFEIAHDAGAGTWQMLTSDATNAFYVTWCDNAVSHTDDDVVVCKDKLYIDKTASLGGVLGTGDTTTGTALIICSNPQFPEPDTVALIEWVRSPVAAYTLTVKGKVVMLCYAGIRIGREDRTLTPVMVSIANPGVITSVGHGLLNGDSVKLLTTGLLPTGYIVGTRYYVVNKTDDTFELSLSRGGASINTSGDQSGIHTVKHLRRIPTSEKATVTFTNPLVGTTQSGFYTPRTPNVTFASLFLYGEIPARRYTTLISDAAVGQKNLVCADTVDWAPGDTLVVGKQYTKVAWDTTYYVIDTVVGNTIAVTANIATYIRKAGGRVCRLGGYGIRFQSDLGVAHTHSLWCPLNFILSGIELYSLIWTRYSQAIVQTFSYAAIATTARGKHLLEYSAIWAPSEGLSILAGTVPQEGVEVSNNIFFRSYGLSGSWNAFYTSAFQSGYMTVRDNYFLGCTYAIQISIASYYHFQMKIYDNTFEHGSNSGTWVALMGKNSEVYDNTFWGRQASADADGSAAAIVNFASCILIAENSRNVRMGGNRFNYSGCAIGFAAGFCDGIVDEGSIFGDEYANDYDFCIYQGGYAIKYTFKDSVSAITGDDTRNFVLDDKSVIQFINYAEVSTNHKGIYKYGKTQSCNATLTDTTVHTPGGNSVRFEPTYTPYSMSVPFSLQIGNCLGKSMTVALWCKINNAAYYAGTKTMPRFTVTYDDVTAVYADATTTTGWQLLTVTFTPATARGTITLTITGATDAAGTNRYFYMADPFILYPVSFKENWGDVVMKSAGFPYMPYLRKRLTPDLSDLIFDY